MDTVPMSGLMEDNIKGTGSTIKCMEKVTTNGEMEEATKDSIRMIKNMALGYTLGLMVVSMLVNG